MTTRWQLNIVRAVVAFLPCGIIAAPPEQQRVAAAPSIERLQRAALIHCTIYARREGEGRELIVTEPTKLKRVREWLQQYAWPPIDLHATGNVMSRGAFSVFEHATDEMPAFTIHVFGITTRAEPHITHVTDADWQKLLSILTPQ